LQRKVEQPLPLPKKEKQKSSFPHSIVILNRTIQKYHGLSARPSVQRFSDSDSDLILLFVCAILADPPSWSAHLNNPRAQDASMANADSEHDPAVSTVTDDDDGYTFVNAEPEANASDFSSVPKKDTDSLSQ
jgi:hypothetical protein